MAYTLESYTMPTLPSPSRPKEAKLFRNNRSQAVRIPVEFELPGDRVLIHREGGKLIIEPVTRPSNIVELLAEWRKEAALGPDDQFPAIDDRPAQPENIF
jgi:antitoxin VapB